MFLFCTFLLPPRVYIISINSRSKTDLFTWFYFGDKKEFANYKGLKKPMQVILWFKDGQDTGKTSLCYSES